MISLSASHSAGLGQRSGSPPVWMPSRTRLSPARCTTGVIASPSRSSPVARPSSPITTSLPGLTALPLSSPAISSALVFAHIV